MSEDDIDAVMSWSSESFISEDGEPDHLVYETSGVLSVDDADERELVGRFRLYYVDVERADNEGVPVWDVMDAHSAAMAEYYESIFEPGSGRFSDRVLELVDYDIAGSNLLVLDRLEILPKYRRKRLGLRVMMHMIRRFSAGTGIIAIKPFPLQGEVRAKSEDAQWWTRLALDQMPADVAAATARLCDYYGQAGFVHLPATPHMIRATSRELPSLYSCS